MALPRLVSIIPVALIALLLLVSASCDTSISQSTTTKPSSISEEITWAAIVQHGQKTGYSYEKTRTFKQDGKLLVETVTELMIESKRLQQTTTLQLKNLFLETSNGNLISFQSEMNAISFSGTVSADGKTLAIKTISAGQEATSTIAWNSEWGGLYATQKILKDTPLEPGEKRSVTALIPLLNQACTVQYEAVGMEEVTMLDGSQVQLMKVINKIFTNAGLASESIIWINNQGQPIKTKDIAQNIEMFKCDEQYAKSPNEVIKFDLAADTIVPVKKDLTGIHTKNLAVYRITLEHTSPDQVFPARSNQYFIKVDKQTIDLHVQRMSIDGTLSIPAIVQVAPVPEDSMPSPLIQSDDQKIIAMSQQVLPAEKSAAVIALAMEKYVHEKITAKNFSTAFASAAEVAQNLEGDCTEHSVLLTALLRARKIPARTAMGLVYFEFPTSKGFAYHMWTEAWVSDRWFPLDATMGRGGIGPGHIKVGDSNLAGAGAFAAFLPVSQVIGQVKIEAVLVE
ncbi:MAG: hypothetical protein COA78_11765 [Blastopirellula sp.]|nr:MAG: hypothetical protein COA78_11765 [Blastopirellula sp.]